MTAAGLHRAPGGAAETRKCHMITAKEIRSSARLVVAASLGLCDASRQRALGGRRRRRGGHLLDTRKKVFGGCVSTRAFLFRDTGWITLRWYHHTVTPVLIWEKSAGKGGGGGGILRRIHRNRPRCWWTAVVLPAVVQDCEKMCTQSGG